MAQSGVAKVLEKFRRSVEAGHYYEAQQMLKTVYHRHRSRGQLEDAYRLAEEGAGLQLQFGQFNCGVELCLMLVEAYAEDRVPPSQEATQRIVRLLALFPQPPLESGTPSPVEDCAKFVAAAVKWLRAVGGEDQAPVLESKLAHYITDCLGWQGLGLALPHYLLAGAVGSAAQELRGAASRAPPEEEDLFVARAVLLAAATPNPTASTALETAEGVLTAYRNSGVAAGRPLPDTPLLNFLDLLLEALRRQSAELARLAAQRYAPSLGGRDPSLQALLDRALAAQLGVQPGGGGPLAGLLGQLLAG